MPSDGWRKPAEQLGLGFQLHVREPKVPTLEVAVLRDVAGGEVRRLIKLAQRE